MSGGVGEVDPETSDEGRGQVRSMVKIDIVDQPNYRAENYE